MELKKRQKKFVVWNIYNPEDDISSSVSYFFIGQYLFSCKWLQLALKDVACISVNYLKRRGVQCSNYLTYRQHRYTPVITTQ